MNKTQFVDTIMNQVKQTQAKDFTYGQMNADEQLTQRQQDFKPGDMK